MSPGEDRSLPARTDRLRRWLACFPRDGAVRVIAPPRAFAMPEEEYEQSIGAHQEVEAGAAVYRLWRRLSGGDRGLALEVGAGAGAATVGFVRAATGFTTVVTDPSPAFLELTRRKIEAAGARSGAVEYATLNGEDVVRLPQACFEIVFLQAALHHIADWKGFLKTVRDVLVPGGIVVLQEPFSDGYLSLGVAADLLIRTRGVSRQDRERLQRLRDSIYLLSDRSVFKNDGEDKHCFYTDEMLDVCGGLFSDVHFLRNQSFESMSGAADLSGAFTREGCAASWLDYCRSFFTAHHKVSAKGIAAFDRHVAPAFAGIEHLYRQGDGPALFAVVVCRRGPEHRAFESLRASLGAHYRRLMGARARH